MAQTRRQVHPCRLGLGIHASDSLGQLPPDVRLTLCLPRLIETCKEITLHSRCSIARLARRLSEGFSIHHKQILLAREVAETPLDNVDFVYRNGRNSNVFFKG
ncbi:MAG: hypothetical protein P8Y45_24505 [Exilibacterium sp.]